jgi:hypothetical protein
MTFVKVVGGNEIYNFPIHRLLHFSTNFWRKSCSNRGSATRFRASRRSAPRRRAAPPESPLLFQANPRPTTHRIPRATRLPVAVPYLRRARGGPPVRPRPWPYARRPRSAVVRRHLCRHRNVTCEPPLFKAVRLSSSRPPPPLLQSTAPAMAGRR